LKKANAYHENKEREQLDAFIKNTCFLPSIQEIVRTKDPPDFVLQCDNKKLSIELTELFKRTKLPYSEQQIEGAEKKIVNGIKKEIEKNDFLIDVTIHFCEPDYPQQGYNINKTIQGLSDLIIKRISIATSDFELISIKRDEKRIDGIFRVNIRNARLYRKKGQPKTRFMRPNKPHWVKYDPFEEIKNAIQEKDKKLKEYHDKYEHSYLLLTTNRLKGSQAFECTKKLRNSTFDTDFDGVFFFDCFTLKAFELKKREKKTSKKKQKPKPGSGTV